MSQTYIYSLSVNFPNGIIPGQLAGEIAIAIPTPALINILINGDVVSIVFVSAIPDQSVLNTVVADHVPIYYNYVNPFFINNLMTSQISNGQFQYFGDQKYQIIISKNSQSRYNSLQAAILDNNAPNNVFLIFPGTYIENNPIILPVGTTITAVGSANNTMIVAQNPSSDLIVMNTQSKLTGMSFVGAYGSGARGLYFDGSLSGGLGKFSLVEECMIIDCNISIESNGNNGPGAIDTFFADKVIISAHSHALSKGVYCHNAGQFIATTFYVYGIPGFFPITNAYYCTDLKSKMSLVTASCWYCTMGLFVDNLGDSEISLLNIQNCGIGCQIGPNGSTSRLSAGSLIFNNSTTYDLDIQSIGANVEIYSSFLTDTKLNNPHNVNITVRYNANLFGNYYQTMLGDTQIGSPIQPSKLGIGEGLYINEGIFILSNSNLISGTWVDNTALALSGAIPATPFNLFQGVSPGNCMYFGSDKDIFGFKINISTATTSIAKLTDLIWEFWNGSAWISFNVMQVFPSAPQHSYLNSFISSQSSFQIRFGLTTLAPFALLVLNGVNKNWVRLRIINAISNIPAGDYVKIHTSSTLINTDGTIEYYGNARVFKDLSIETFSSGLVTSSQEFFFAPNLSVAKPNNVFSHGSIIRVGFSFKMPIEIDTSFPIKLNIGFVCNNSNSGNVLWTIRYVYSSANGPIYLTSADAQNNPNPNIIVATVTSTIASNQNNQDLRSMISLNISNFPASLSSSDKYIFYGVLERNSTVSNPSDTYPGNVFLSGLDANFCAWCNFGKIINF